VLLNLQLLAADNPGVSPLVIRLRAFWYSARGDGNITLEFSTYLGGSMEHIDYDFVNVGGVEQQTIRVPRAIMDDAAHSNVDGEECGALVYDPVTRSAQIIAP
jgi:hypothetical protein